jgi:release factor glutamine methyltransferase
MPDEKSPSLHRFMGVELIAPRGVLKPRIETELLAQRAIDALNDMGSHSRPLVIDICCGSGNLALALATYVPTCRIWAADLTDDAVIAARQNVALHDLAARVEVRQGDLFAALAVDTLEGSVDLIVCNPPYISTSRLDGPSADLLTDEPREAFDGGPFGLSIHQRLVREALAYLKPGGILMCEFGEGQSRQVVTLIERSKAYHPPELVCDDNDMPRVAVARKLGLATSAGVSA